MNVTSYPVSQSVVALTAAYSSLSVHEVNHLIVIHALANEYGSSSISNLVNSLCVLEDDATDEETMLMNLRVTQALAAVQGQLECQRVVTRLREHASHPSEESQPRFTYIPVGQRSYAIATNREIADIYRLSTGLHQYGYPGQRVVFTGEIPLLLRSYTALPAAEVIRQIISGVVYDKLKFPNLEVKNEKWKEIKDQEWQKLVIELTPVVEFLRKYPESPVVVHALDSDTYTISISRRVEHDNG